MRGTKTDSPTISFSEKISSRKSIWSHWTKIRIPEESFQELEGLGAWRVLIKDGDEILRKKCRPVKEINPHIIRLLDDMKATLRKANGVGLAAPQVGVLRRIAIVECEEGELIEIINPEIISSEGEQEEIEGCLSVPGRWG
ncbi:MAG: peptide deformylase, partial [Verrucomicrobia bacterium]|nr:peptide deformylase [Verrucomicrobiota bacterium]